MSEAISGAVVEGEVKQIQELQALENEAAEADFVPTGEEVVEGEASPEMSTGELMTGVLSIGFSLVAARRGDHWALNQTEAEETGAALGSLLDKYFPDMNAHGPELTVLLTMGAVVGPRLILDQKIEHARAVNKRKKENAPVGSVDEKQDAPSLDLEVA